MDERHRMVAFPAIRVIDRDLLQRAIEVYDLLRLDFADAYLVASAERTGIGVIASVHSDASMRPPPHAGRGRIAHRTMDDGLHPVSVDHWTDPEG